MLVFIHIEKTAGTTLKFLLRNNFGTKHCDSNKTKRPLFTQEDLEHAKKVFGRIDSLAGHNLVAPTEHLKEEDARFLTFLREPLARSASHYQDHCYRGTEPIAFEDWMAEKAMRNMQTKRIAGVADAERAKKILKEEYAFIGLTERFQESLKLLNAIVDKDLNLRTKQKLIKTDNRIKESLLHDERSSRILREANEEDLELYRYVKEELFPEKLNEYQGAVDRMEIPEPYAEKEFVFGHRKSLLFNKIVYKQLSKLRG